ncbi:MAG: hypothetical protein ICV56_01525 [Nitrososphaeraceae archaeon]|nr:hypothetical protein [Nitrososphaeraceae archaeon]
MSFFFVAILEPNKKSVSVRWQMLFAVIPFVNFWAAYRIKKLRKFLLIWIGLFGLSLLISILVPFPFSTVITLVIEIPILIYYIRKWSIEWNNKMESKYT